MVKIIAEIGFNHLGKFDIANEYLDILLETDVDCITFQIREKEHQLKGPHKYFSEKQLSSLFSRIKASEKQVGVAIADIDYIPFLEMSKVDFYKVIRNDITNRPLLDQLRETGKPVYVSTGMASEEEIENFTSYFKGNFKLVHTQLSYSIEDCNLKSIHKMKDYDLEVAYGHHCSDRLSIFMALCYEPSDIFLYIKGNKDMEYPDDKHAIEVGAMKSLITTIRQLEKAKGDGIKQKMINKIEA